MGRDSTKLLLFLRGKKPRWLSDLLWVGGFWLVILLCDRVWLALDNAPPTWDEGDYLTGSLFYWRALQTPQWLSGRWWTELWLMSSKIPPLVYMSAAPIITLFGKMPDQMMLLFLVYSAILLSSVYFLGCYLFNRWVGLWAAGLCVLMPTFYQTRLEYLLDYPLSAMVALAFLALTLWWGEWRFAGEWVALEPAVQDESAIAPPAGQSKMPPQDGSQLKGWYGAMLAQVHPVIGTRVGVAMGWLSRQWPLWRPWGLAIAAGIALGLSLLTKQTAGLFLLIPLCVCAVATLWCRAWWQSAQFLLLFLASFLVWMPWYRTNWLLILTSSKRATIDSAALQGAPSLLSWEAWAFYILALPEMVSWPLFLLPVIGFLLFWRRSRLGQRGDRSIDYDLKSADYRQKALFAARQSLIWLLIFCVGGYLLSTLNPNKDNRYFAPCLPILAVILAYGMTLLPRSWRLVQWASVALSSVLMLATLFPFFAHPQKADPFNSSFPYRGQPYPLTDVISAVRQTEPFLRSTIGVLPSTPQVNQHNVNFFGLTQNFQVYGRQVGTRQQYVAQDRRSLDWFLLKTGDQGVIRKPEAQSAITQQVAQGGDFELQKSWPLPDASQLELYRRRVPAIAVQQQVTGTSDPSAPVRLDQATVPPTVPPGQPIPVTYQWSGTWDDLHQGLMVLTWQRQDNGKPDGQTTGPTRWLHDHAIGLGMLYPDRPKSVSGSTPFQVIERMAMMPPANAPAGTYQLEAVYLNRVTGQTTPIAIPKVTVQLSPTATPVPAPELDLGTQLRSLAVTLPKGTPSLERISNEISRINQYDPVQDYLTQVQQATQYRLTLEPGSVNHAYTLALATVLKRQVHDAIAALQRVTQLDAKNPYAYAYLAFVYLYDFQPRHAQNVLSTALKLAPDNPDVNGLNGIAALMRGNLLQAWHSAQVYQKAQRLRG